MNPVEIENHLKLVLLSWSVIIAVAWMMGQVAKMFGQPLAVGEIAGGLLLGPSVLGAISPDSQAWLFPKETQQSLQLLAKIGLIFLLFQVGMEFNYRLLADRKRAVLWVSVMGVLASVLAGIAIGPWLHQNFGKGIPQVGFQMFICVALSISALPIMGRILFEMKLERTAIGALGISSAALVDIANWIMLAVATALVKSQFNGSRVVAQLIGVVALFLLLKYSIGPWLRKIWRATSEKEGSSMPMSFLALLLVVLMATCLATAQLGVFSIFGAFMLGVVLSEEEGLVRAWRERLAGFVIIALVPVFFTNTGLRTEIGSLQGTTAWMGCALVLLAAVFGKLGGCWLGARLAGQSNDEAKCVAALMNTRALMGLVAINIGLELGLLTKELFTMFVIMALCTTVMTMPLLRWWLPKELRDSGNGERRH